MSFENLRLVSADRYQEPVEEGLGEGRYMLRLAYRRDRWLEKMPPFRSEYEFKDATRLARSTFQSFFHCIAGMDFSFVPIDHYVKINCIEFTHELNADDWTVVPTIRLDIYGDDGRVKMRAVVDTWMPSEGVPECVTISINSRTGWRLKREKDLRTLPEYAVPIFKFWLMRHRSVQRPSFRFEFLCHVVATQAAMRTYRMVVSPGIFLKEWNYMRKDKSLEETVDIMEEIYVINENGFKATDGHHIARPLSQRELVVEDGVLGLRTHSCIMLTVRQYTNLEDQGSRLGWWVIFDDNAIPDEEDLEPTPLEQFIPVPSLYSGERAVIDELRYVCRDVGSLINEYLGE